MTKEASSESDSWMSGTATKVAVLLLVLWVLKKIWPGIRQRYFAFFMNYQTVNANPKVKEIKKDFLASISSCVSHDPQLRKEKAIKLLEIGVGTGANFQSYPNGTRLVVVDPNPHFKSYYDANRKKFPNIHSEEIIVSTAEEMNMIASNSMDVVVSTWVFCSISTDNLKQILQQILRVLAPGGKFYFFEHVAEFDLKLHGTRHKMQRFLTATGIWPFLFDGCYLTRDMLEAIEQAGFSKVEAQRFYNCLDHPILKLINPTLKGVAEK